MTPEAGLPTGGNEYGYSAEDMRQAGDDHRFVVREFEEKLDRLRHENAELNRRLLSCTECAEISRLTTALAERDRLIHRATRALQTVMGQPFKGDWDAQAVFVRDILAELRNAKEGRG